MPLASDIDVTDNIILNFDKPNEKKLFKVTVSNKGKSIVKVSQIRSYCSSVAVVNFDKKHAVIEPDGQMDYLFESELVANETTEEKLRFTFNSRNTVTRTIKLVKYENDTVSEDESKSVKNEEEEKKVKKDESMTCVTVNIEKDHQVDANEQVKNGINNKLKNIENKVPENGLLHIDLPKEDVCMKEFRKELCAIDINDNLFIRFDRDQCDKSCEIFIRNNTWHPFHLQTIHIDTPTITVRGGKCKAFIEPRGEFWLVLDAEYVPDRFFASAKVSFYFENVTIIRRTIGIQYRERGRVIQKDVYDAPIDLVHMIFSGKQMPKSEILSYLDGWIPSMKENYAEYFHRLLYLEEVGLRKEMEDVYNARYRKSKSYFGVKDRFKKDGHEIRQNYAHGLYDLQVNELCDDTRPLLQVGDQLKVRKHSEANIVYEGFIIDVKETDLIVVKFNDDFVETFDHSPYSIEFSFSRSYFIRQHFAIDLSWEFYGTNILMPNEISLRGVPVLDMCMEGNIEMIQRTTGKMQPWFNDNLNEQQKNAVMQIIRGDLLNPYLIFGPPGTGKTTTLVEIILQLLASHKMWKILITTQSNSASNLIAQRLVESKQVDANSLLRLISHNYSNRMESVPEDIVIYSRTINDLMEEDEEKEVNFFEKLELVKKYRVVVGTFAAISKLLEANTLRNHFTHSVIDEAGQCTEADVLVPMALVGKGGQTIMAGDPLQMPPLVFNKEANARGLAVSMLGRLIQSYTDFRNDDAGHKKNFGPLLISKLVHSYRSLPSILGFNNKQFYNSELIPMIDAESSREALLLKHLDGIFPNVQNRGAYGIHFVNVDDGRNQKWKKSWFNLNEARVTVALVEKLIKFDLTEDEIGIITPYAIQLRALKKYHKETPDIKVGTVEDFQGLERKVILISTVRTCSTTITLDVNRQLGFIKCPNRINVATSRARVMVIVVGNAETLSLDKHWKALIDGCKENGTFTESVLKQN